MHSSTFEYLKPTDAQINDMAICRQAVADCASCLEANVPAGADKTYLLRKLREVGMWANVACTRHADGTPRQDDDATRYVP